jgi:hypothetical protein
MARSWPPIYSRPGVFGLGRGPRHSIAAGGGGVNPVVVVAGESFPADGGLLTNFASFDNAAWTKTLCTVSADAANNPSTGTATADKLCEDDNFNVHYLLQSYGSVDQTVQRTGTLYAKASDRTSIIVGLMNVDGTSGASVLADLTGVAISDTETAGTATLHSSSITASADGFYKIVLTVTVADSGTAENYMKIGMSAATTYAFVTGLTSQYQGTAPQGIFIWGANVVA